MIKQRQNFGLSEGDGPKQTTLISRKVRAAKSTINFKLNSPEQDDMSNFSYMHRVNGKSNGK